MPALNWNWHVQDAEVSSEERLAVELKEGGRDAFSEVVQRYTPRLLATARRFLRCEDDCQEAVQEAFFSAYKNLGTFLGQSHLGTWLHRIVINACLMRLRRLGRRKECSFQSLEFRGGAGFETHRFADADEPSGNLQRQETRSWVLGGIASLPSPLQQIIHLRDLEQLSTQDVAARLGISPGAVKTRLHRARRALKNVLQQTQREPAAC